MLQNTSDTVYHSMRDQIISATWEPGKRLVHRQLAKEFGTSNIPVVEALRRLEGDGLITSYPNAGAHVREWAEDDIQEAFLAREALEGVTCRLFVERASRREKAKLIDLNQDFDNACKEKNYDKARAADIALHLYIAGNYSAAAQSSPIFRLVQSSCLLTATIRSVYGENLSIGPIGAHDALVEALQSDDPELAEQAGKEHVQSSTGFIQSIIAR